MNKKKQQSSLAEKKKKENRIILITVSSIAAVALIAVILVVLFAPKTQELPNTVRLNVSYTSNDGVQHTGDIILELDPTNAPITVANFKKLVSEKFYDGLIFHRIVDHFVIQGGDPEGTGYGGSSETIKGEFTANNVNNQLKHVRGVISMARSGDSYDSASSQFFIVTETSANNSYSLDGKYAAFGKVVSGMDVVDGIAAVATNADDRPLKDAVINYATFVTAN